MRHGIGLKGVLGTVHAYPTYAEANRHVAGTWRRAHASPAVMGLLARFHAWRRGRPGHRVAPDLGTAGAP